MTKYPKALPEKKRITMMQLRSEPGEWIHHRVYKHGETIIITHCGKDIVEICPLETTVINSLGECNGQRPLTFQRPDLIRKPNHKG